jgi:hypothetical protein
MSSVSDSTAYSNAAKRQQESYDAERAQSRVNQEDEVRKLKEEQEQQTTRTRDEYNSRVSRVREEANEEVKKLKDEMYDKSGKKSATDSREVNQERSKLNEYRSEIDRAADRRIKSAESAAEAKASKSTQSEGDRVQTALAAQKRSQQNEIGELRKQIDAQSVDPRDISREKANARQEVIQTYEGDHLKERDQLATAYEQRLDKVASSQDDKEDYYNRRLVEASANKDANAQKQIQAQKDNFSKIEHQHQVEQQQMKGYYENQVKSERAKNNQSEGVLIQRNNEQVEHALAQKDQTYQDYLKQSSASHKQELSSRDQEITKLKTTDNPFEVSPFLMNKIQTTADQRNYEQWKGQYDSNQKNLQAEQKRDYSERLELKDSDDQRYTQFTRTHQKQNDVEKRQFLTGYTELKLSKEQAERQTQEQHNDRIERVQSKHSQEMGLQERKMADAMQVQRETLLGSKLDLQTELEAKNRGKERELGTQLNQIRRDYDRKVLDEQDSKEKQVSELKYSFDKKLQDLDRTSKKALDDRVKSYEHQIKQQELAFKDRERFLTEHYEEELDSMRRTNARLIQKKS